MPKGHKISVNLQDASTGMDVCSCWNLVDTYGDKEPMCCAGHMCWSFTPGVASKLALNILVSSATGTREVSAVSAVTETDAETADFLLFCRAFWTDAVSDGRLASWWKRLRFRMMAYTRLELPKRQIQE